MIFGLFDSGLSDAERQEMADALLQVPRAPTQMGKPTMPNHIIVPNPRLASFIGPQSWKLWDLLGVESNWLQLPVAEWERACTYGLAYSFVKGLKVVNDGAERCIRSITDYAYATRDSIYREEILLVGNSHRDVFQDLRRAALGGL